MSSNDGTASSMSESIQKLELTEQGLDSNSSELDAGTTKDSFGCSENSQMIGVDINSSVEKSLQNEDSSPLKESEFRSADARCVLEDFTQCHKSHLWKLMMSFYERKGPDSWAQGIVPHFITSNSFIGKSYAKVLHGFLADCLSARAKMPVDVSEPLYIIELGTGSGKFSFYMLKALDEMKATCEFPWEKIVYVMTDFTEKNFSYWKSHPALRDYFDSGRLDAGIFDATNDNHITLWRSGTVLSANSLKNPMCIVANYLFDTLYHDIFQVDKGVLKEGLVSTGSKHSVEPDPLEPEIITRLENTYRYLDITADYYTEEEGDELHFRRILTWYQEYFKAINSDASILVPLGALRALRRLTTFSGGRAIVISGDKGNNNPEQFCGLMDPHIAVHGSFSLMVNYHAIGLWFTSKGGFALHNPQEEASLKVSTFILSPESTFAEEEGIVKVEQGLVSSWTGESIARRDSLRSQYFPYLRQAFHDSLDSFGPNDFFVLQKSLVEDTSNPPLRSVVSLLKLGDWDPDVFFKFRDTILKHAPNCGQKLRNDLCRGVVRVWQNHYTVDKDKDIAFEIGRFYYGIRDYDHALEFYKISSETVGEHHVTFHNQGLCYYSLNQLELAVENFRKAVKMNSNYEKARNWLDKTVSEISFRLNKTTSAEVNGSAEADTVTDDESDNVKAAGDTPSP